MKQVASLQYGVVFKKAFCDPEIFSAFVRDVIGLPIEVDHVETEKEFDPPVGYVRPRFDLFAEDTKHRVIVDIQHARTADHYDRFLYYHCVALLEQIAKMTGGQVVPPTAIDEVLRLASLSPEVTETVQRTPLWNRWSNLWIVLGCLSIEWIVRKRKGLV